MLRKTVGIVLAALLTLGGTAAEASHTEREHFDIEVSADSRLVGDFRYLRHLTRYDSQAGWTDGDRVGYRCAYMFLVYGSEIVGRVTFTRIAYAFINDRYMAEGERYYDGSQTPPGTRQVPPSECPRPSERYKRLKGRPGPRPVISFLDAGDGHTLEVRNYNRLETTSGHRFKIDSARPNRVTVIVYQDRRPTMAVYYQRLSEAIRLSSNAKEA